MPTKRTKTTGPAMRRTGIRFDEYLTGQLRERDFGVHYEQRRLVHDVAIAVRSMRENAGLTQAQLAEIVGTSQPSIARMEKGLDQRTPRWETLHKIARALGKNLRFSFEDADDGADVLVEVNGIPVRASQDAPAGGR
ncbi:helix-turn-helix domain-containing protein [Anaeromyxobacter dehalogenans]|uniref:Transcriptional regulator, XRE family n=1 Tax=Anaeromyxobacter dehalogenans (strain 2CP-C) TaxID=290397 RepID=Q2IJ29_ANADE|nr:helix-turn-helix transcriptional regulator [Anaeromyxobacter dehalogenans]ABC81659.1 transcriptional regulator, XRE family [Anaeromyxobacter dehalogenans 2CP-C]